MRQGDRVTGLRQMVARLRRTMQVDPFLIGATLLGLAAAAGSAVLIAKLLDSVMGGEDDGRRDGQILDWVVQHRSPGWTSFFRVVTHLADPVVVIVLTSVLALVLARGRRRRLGMLVVASTVGTAIVTTAAKWAVDRGRPPEQLWLTVAAGPAFPSGHSAQALALYGASAVVVFALVRDVAARVVAVALACLIAGVVGLSRAYLGVHWASDVLCGWAVAMLWLSVLLLIGWSWPRFRSSGPSAA